MAITPEKVRLAHGTAATTLSPTDRRSRTVLGVLAAGMVTGVGLTADSTCAAIRAKINRFQETHFMDCEGEWIMASSVPLESPWRGRAKLVQMLILAIREALVAASDSPQMTIPFVLCVAEKDRPGRLEGLDDLLLPELLAESHFSFNPDNTVLIAQGATGGAVAVELARKLIFDRGFPCCLIAGVDTFLVGPTLVAFEGKDRLLTSDNSNGFIPGEAAAAVLLGPSHGGPQPQMHCLGVGFGKEEATIESEEPLRADGMLASLRAACSDAGCSWDDLHYRLTDLNGEQYKFKEASLALTRFSRNPKSEFETWHPADSIGEVGAAIVPCVLGLALNAAQKGYAPGKSVLCHFSNDDGDRAALVLSYSDGNGDP